MNSSSQRQRELRALKDMAMSSEEAPAKAMRARPNVTMSADSSGYVDLDALAGGADGWIAEAERRAAAAKAARSTASARPPLPAHSPQRPAVASITSFTSVSTKADAMDSLTLEPDEDEDASVDVAAYLPRQRRLMAIVACVSAMCLLICGFAVRAMVVKRAADAAAFSSAQAVAPAILPPLAPEIPPPPPAAEPLAAQAPTILELDANAPSALTHAAKKAKAAGASHRSSTKPQAARATTHSAPRAPSSTSAQASSTADPLEAAIRRSLQPSKTK